MRTPPRLLPLVEDGIIDEVVGQVRSGKEADVFVVRVGDDIRCAKVYKDSSHRSFKQAASYQEGRRIQNSRSARALSKRSAFGQKEAETNWITAEVQALNTLSAAGVRVPKPFGFFEGVLVMELIVDASGDVAPRLDDVELTPEIARRYHQEMIQQIVLMLCAGIIHGDLSEFNVLVDERGPVIIDLPQAINAAGNNNAQTMLARDVDNVARYFGGFDPEILKSRYAQEIWSLYQNGLLHPHVELTGAFEETQGFIDVGGVLEAIEDARREHEDALLQRAAPKKPSAIEPPLWQNPSLRADGPADSRRSKRPDGRDARQGNARAPAVPPRPSVSTPPATRRDIAPVPPAKLAPVEPAPPPRMQWGRRPGR